jgi:hypothetical protein
MHTLPVEVLHLLRLTPYLRELPFELADALGEGPVLMHKGLHPFFHLVKSGLKVLQIVFPSIFISKFETRKPCKLELKRLESRRP